MIGTAEKLDQFSGIDELLGGLFDGPVAVAVSDPRDVADGIFAQEQNAMRGAVEKRRREFAAGRRAARASMQMIGYAPSAVPVAGDRAPVWPDAITGSISHTSTICAAAVTRRCNALSVGLDIEDEGGLDADLLPIVCTLSERAWVSSQPVGERAWLSKLIFSAKESAYKCQYAVSGTLFDFHTLEVTPDLDLGLIEATFLRDIPGFVAGTQIAGRFVVSNGLIATGTTLPAISTGSG